MEQTEVRTDQPLNSEWMGALRILPCKDAEAHWAQANAIKEAQEMGEDCEITYTNALYCGVFPCFVEYPADVDTTCISIAWPDESYEEVIAANGASRKQPGLILRALLAHHLFGLGNNDMARLTIAIKLKLQGEYDTIDYDQWKPFAPIFDWHPATCGEEHLVKLQELFPPPRPFIAEL